MAQDTAAASTASPQPPARLDGTTTMDDKLKFEPERLSYEAAVRLARQIADDVCTRIPRTTNGKPDHPVVVASSGYLADLANRSWSEAVLDGLKQDYDAV